MSKDEAIAEEQAPFEDVATDQIVDSGNAMTDITSRIENEDITPEEVEANIRQIEAMAATYPEVAEMQEYKNLVELASKMRSEDGEEEIEEEDEEEIDQDDADDEAQDDDSGSVSGDVFGVTKRKKKALDIDFEINSDTQKYLAEKYSIEDPSKFFSSADQWRQDSQQLSELSKTHDEVLHDLRNLPAPIKDAIVAYSNAEDYQSAFMNSGGRLNYDMDFRDQERDVIVKHYFSDKLDKLYVKLNEGDIDEDDYEERVDDLFDSSKRLYEADQREFDEKRAEIIARNEREVQSMQKSALSSVESLKKAYPDFSKADFQRVKQRLVDGNIEGLFFNEDGTYKAEAAEMLAMAMYGSSVIASLLEEAELRGATEANKAIVQRGDKKPKTKASVKSAAKAKAMDQISHLTQEFRSDPYA